MRILLLKNYPDIARCCYYEYHYLWQVVRVLNFWCQPIRDQDSGNWPIRGKSSLCCDKCWQWAASFLQPEQNTSKGQNESLLFHQTWHEQSYLFMLDCGGEFSRTDLGEGWQGIRNPAGAKFSFSLWNDVSSPLLAPLTTIHPQQMLTKTTIATGSSAPEIYRIHHLDTYCVKSHSQTSYCP